MKLTAAALALALSTSAAFAQALPDLGGREIVVVTENAYHGVTAAVAEFSPSLGSGVPLGAHVRTVPAPDAALGDPAVRFTADVQAAIDDLIRHGIKPAVLIVDTVFSSDGVHADPKGFLQGAVLTLFLCLCSIVISSVLGFVTALRVMTSPVSASLATKV